MIPVGTIGDLCGDLSIGAWSRGDDRHDLHCGGVADFLQYPGSLPVGLKFQAPWQVIS